MCHRIILSLFVLSSWGSIAQNKYFEVYTDAAALKKDNDALIKDFEDRLRVIAPKLSLNQLKTEVPTTFMPGMYKSKTNTIYQVTWPTTKPVMGELLTRVAGSEKEGVEMAGSLFYGFFLPHEIAHAFLFNAKKEPANKYDSEYEANVIAVLYWRKVGKDQELKKCYSDAKKALSKLKNPIPENVDRKTYFTEHYNEFLAEPEKYGFIQFSQIVRIFEDRSLPDFDTYIKQVLGRK